MRVLLIGSGGREHALAWKIAQSPLLTRLFIAPGNSGTALHGENVPLLADEHQAIVRFCREQRIELVIVGPESPLASGLADDLTAAGFRVFGPTRAAAQIEASKVFSKQFMSRHGIPTAPFAVFTDFEAARRYLRTIDHPVVIKASGLAAGKGVFVPANREQAEEALRQMMIRQEFGAAGKEVVVEERLEGQEVTLLAFSDGKTVRPMLPAQDHKRIFDGDEGPNTGGMGAYAPVPICPPKMVDELMRVALLPAIEGLREEGYPFVGVLYGGFMLTAQGPRVIEFNCRFGDPEAQVILPLLETDLLEVAEACVEGRLDEMELSWRDGASACVVLASGGYPGTYKTGYPIRGLDSIMPPNIVIFHAGTKIQDGQIVTAGGRVLAVTGWAKSLPEAVRSAYMAVDAIQFEEMHYRKDIAYRALRTDWQIDGSTDDQMLICDYAAAGVDIDAGNQAVELMKTAVKSTYGPEVVGGIGSFGGLYDASALQRMQAPVLVSSTDGVGTKVKLAAATGCYRSIGHDIVNHCINDILVQGARPLFFLDYFAASKLAPDVVAEVVTGMAEACRQAKVALIGGETAEMPGVYAPKEFDVAGTIVGVVERAAILPRPNVCEGDVVIGFASSGPHTNGYSLIRKIFKDVPLDTVFPELGISLGEALLAPHRSYYSMLYPLLAEIKALAHLTGGGFIENIPRVLPEGIGAVIHTDAWPVPPLFQLIQRFGNVSREEMYRVFNMGIGMVAIVEKGNVTKLRHVVAEETWVIGELVAGHHTVILE